MVNASSQLNASYVFESFRKTIGCVIRPSLSSSISENFDHSCTVFDESNLGVNRFLVASVANAFAPFSQNSNPDRWSSGSGQAQPGQSYPSNRLTVRIVLIVRASPASDNPIRKDLVTPRIPAATRFGFPIFNLSA